MSVETTKEILTYTLLICSVLIGLGGVWKMWGKPTQTWFQEVGTMIVEHGDVMKSVDEQLKINGEDKLLPDELQGLPIRSLVIALAVILYRHIATATDVENISIGVATKRENYAVIEREEASLERVAQSVERERVCSRDDRIDERDK